MWTSGMATLVFVTMVLGVNNCTQLKWSTAIYTVLIKKISVLYRT